jgi:hypothetical protein
MEQLPQGRIKDACIKYAKMETMLGEVDRARGIYTHASQFCDPRKDEEFWKQWRGFEVQHGNEDTFRDMLRIKRSVQAMFAQVHFNATDIAAEATTGEELDPMQAAEQQLKEAEERKRAGGAMGTEPAAKRQRTADAVTARKELLSEFQPTERFLGARKGMIFKLGVKGLGYYEDSSIQELEARARRAAQEEREVVAEERRAAAPNPEEIDLQLDDDDEDEPEPAAQPRNPEEIEINFEDIEEAPVPAQVFGGSLSGIREQAIAEAPEVEEPPLAEPAAKAEAGGSRARGALSRFAKGKGKGPNLRQGTEHGRNSGWAPSS